MKEMEANISKNYDDFDQLEVEGRTSKEGLFSPFTFIVVSFLLTLTGLLMLYSASFDVSVKNGFDHYHFFLNQIYGLFAGLAFGVILNYLPIKIIRKSYYVLCPVALALLVIELFPSIRDSLFFTSSGERIISTPLIGTVSVVSMISSTIDSIAKRNEMNGFLYALVFFYSIAIAILCALTSGISYYFLITFIALLILYSSGSSKGFVAIVALFSISSGLFLIVMVPDILSSVASSMFPVSDPSLYDHDLFTSQLAIKDGGLAGVGLGKGLYKYGSLKSIESQYIFSSIAEETGFIGIILIYFLFFLYFLLGLMATKRSFRRHNHRLSGATLGITLIIVLQAVMNALYCSGLFALGKVMLPFFSYGPFEMAIYMALTALLFRFIYMMGRGNDSSY